MLGQRLAKAEDTNAQLQGELSVVTDKMKLTEAELAKARLQAKKIKEDDAKQLADLQNNSTASSRPRPASMTSTSSAPTSTA